MSEEIVAVNSQSNVLGGIYSSVNAETQAERLAIYDAVSNAAPLDDVIGTVLHVSNIIMQPVEMTDAKTGEITERYRIVLIDEDGTAYGCVSSGVETSIRNLMAIVGPAPWEPALLLKPVKKQGRNGYKFTTLVHVS
jgi:hypothetical protein